MNVTEQLIIAANDGDLKSLESLLVNGADMNDVDDEFGRTALHFAAFNGHLDCIKLLIEKGCAIDAKDKDGSTPLQRAASNNCFDCVQLLVESGAEINTVNDKGLSVIHDATLESSFDMIAYLMSKGARLDDNQKTGYSMLHYAVLNGKTEVVDLFIRKGIDPKKPNFNGETPLDLAREMMKIYDNRDLVQHLAFYLDVSEECRSLDAAIDTSSAPDCVEF